MAKFAILSLFFIPPLMLLVLSPGVSAFSLSAVYGGGPIYKDRSITIPELKSSGFSTIVVWTIHIESNGDFGFNAEFPLVAGGKYIGNAMYPYFPSDIANLKKQPTGVSRIEFGLAAAGSGTFANIKSLVASQGTGPNSILYKNFQILKQTIPSVDAINFDDETTYDIPSSVQFAVMLADLGYKITLCPYTSSDYWANVATQTNEQRSGAVDAVFLQCYSGGAGNDPCSSIWNFNGIRVYPGVWDQDLAPQDVRTQMTGWKSQCGITGGFMWIYDEFVNNGKAGQYAASINGA